MLVAEDGALGNDAHEGIPQSDVLMHGQPSRVGVRN